MAYSNAKVYYDGSHYIGIPKSTVPKHLVRRRQTRYVSTKEKELKEIFNKLYRELANKGKKPAFNDLVAGMRQYFITEEETTDFIKEMLERMKINRIVRQTRLYRKVMLQQWNYFCTFTYDDKKQTAETFKVKLLNNLKHMSCNKGWKYIGVWELTPRNNRLHLHGLFYIPEGTMIGKLEKDSSYDTRHHRRQTTYQNTHYLKKFGRNDFEEINENDLPRCVRYITKYLEKSGEKLIYSKGLPTFFYTDILDEDVICKFGMEDKKLILFDDFTCIDNGEYVGKVNDETIQQLRKGN